MADGDGFSVPFIEELLGMEHLLDMEPPWRLDDLKFISNEDPCMESVLLDGSTYCLEGEKVTDDTLKISALYACNGSFSFSNKSPFHEANNDSSSISSCGSSPIGVTASIPVGDSLLNAEPYMENVTHVGSLRKASNVKASVNVEKEEHKCVVGEKRIRRPTRRYIEEVTDYRGRRRKCNSYSFTRRGLKRTPSNGSRFRALVCEKVSFGGSCIQVPFGAPVEIFRDKHSSIGMEYVDCKENEVLNAMSDKGEASPESSCDNRSTGRNENRRKHYKLWSLCEVTKLVEGVIKYGVGRWTEIKRLLFSSANHRSPVDLKDKWRNLVRSSCTELRGKEGVQGRKVASHPIPQSLLLKIRELSVRYPYPREGKLV